MKKCMMAALVLGLAVSASAAEKKTKAVKAEEPAQKAWTTALNLGLTLTDGNSETLAVNGSLVTEGEREGLGSLLAGAEVNYGENTVDGVEETTVENAKAYVNVKKTLSPRTFVSLDSSVLYDDVAAIDYRALLGPGLGFYALKNDKHELSLEAGPSYVWGKIGGLKEDYLALRFAERFTCQMLPNAKLVQSLEYVPEAEDFDNYRITAEAGVEAAMSDRLSLRVVLQDQYVNLPAEGKERNDLSLIAGVGLTL
ncbi:MAG: DUF481 domain-containing protein [Lentisphaerae bacterium]|nr:DUF481 domain-containing protein [Lentisphaerota bacterium]